MIYIDKIIVAYHKLLTIIDWKDHLLIEGIREGLNKFPSNAFIYATGKKKYFCGHYYSKNALDLIRKEIFSGLIFEHMIPKQFYIQEPCIKAAKSGELKLNDMRDLFEKYWKIAIITKEENALLNHRKMPANWDTKNIFSRYDEAGINLEPSPFINHQEKTH